MADEKWDLKLVPYTDKVLKERVPEMDLSNYDLKELETELIKLSEKWNGAGLSANQVGLPLRYFVVTVKDWKKAYFNPEIYWSGEETCMIEEGCLSRPGLWLKLVRPTVIRIVYTNSDGIQERAECAGMLSRVLQHEYDHMEGKDFTQYAGYAKLQMALKKQKNTKKKLVRALAKHKGLLKANTKGRFETAPPTSLELSTESKPVSD